MTNHRPVKIVATSFHDLNEKIRLEICDKDNIFRHRLVYSDCLNLKHEVGDWTKYQDAATLKADGTMLMFWQNGQAPMGFESETLYVTKVVARLSK